ncbi:uncharacterized protein LOC117103339 [Anneissia japonica]|uniref:uncharacterized protein LOC117103339 n=1 Tax=Anneissia japonica TaxID=1529436 RepID=UPI0014259A4A|nr:uncharacterized protein LOC117103339 [Anneissia japonica]
MLKVLFRDHVTTGRLSEISSTMELLNHLVVLDHLNANKIAILHDTISITKHLGVQRKIKERLSSFSDVKEGTTLKHFTNHRQNVMKFGMKLTPDAVKKIGGFYNKKYTDRWSMITDLENMNQIFDGDMKDFIELLKSLKLHRALNALLEGIPHFFKENRWLSKFDTI